MQEQEEAIQKILIYSKDILFDSDEFFDCYWPKEVILKRAYALWTVDEILNALMDRPFDAPDTVIEEFILKMEYFLRISKNAESERIFSTAEDTAEDILDYVLS